MPLRDQERPVICDDEVALLAATEVLQALCLVDDLRLVEVSASDDLGSPPLRHRPQGGGRRAGGSA